MSAVLEYIVNKLKDRQKVGLKKYGVSIDDCDPPTGCFKLEVIEETTDGLQYMARECMRLEEENRRLKEEQQRLQDRLEEFESDHYNRQISD